MSDKDDVDFTLNDKVNEALKFVHRGARFDEAIVIDNEQVLSSTGLDILSKDLQVEHLPLLGQTLDIKLNI